jgi:catechol 2,3-dioxygenase-like lactoylglutathione lyase family enzyme
MSVAGLDHVAIPTARPEQMLEFYRALGFSAPTPDEWRRSGARVFAIQFGNNKINVHAPALWENAAFTLRGPSALPGCGDFCFVWAGTAAQLSAALQSAGAAIEEGPVKRIGGRDGGRAEGSSVYTRDPDGNLLEFIIY